MSKGRILIVDDQEEILNSLGAILADEGYELLRASDGHEAIHIVQSDSPDIVFLDIWIPGIDGMQALKAIKKIAPDCSVVMMSGHGTIETAVKAIKLGATDYLEKPLNLDDVLHLVEKAVSGKTKTSPDSNDLATVQIIGESAQSLNLRRTLERGAHEPGTVWFAGDQGTGKEFLARILHQLEGKNKTRLIKVRCSELTESNLEATFLGKYNESRTGKIQQAAGGTLLLIRIDKLEKNLQEKFHGLIRNYVPRGFSALPLRQRIVCTANTGPDTLVESTGFPRQLADLLSNRIIRVPSLRERKEDIPLFAEYFLKEVVEEFDKNIAAIEPAAGSRLREYSWPGNVKELKLLVERVVMTAPGPNITVNDLLMPWGAEETAGSGPSASGRIESGPKTGAKTLFQKTLRGKVVMYGQGLHSGAKTGLTLSPLPPNTGILFGHITSDDTISASVENVQSTELSTSLKSNGSFARTIEHLMAVFHIYGLTNLLVKISGEVPIMDGSALDFCNLVESAEIIVQDEPVEVIRITEPFELPAPSGSPKRLRVEPSDAFEVEYFMDYPAPVGTLHMKYTFESPTQFKTEIAPARTFGFVRDLKMMNEMGLADGGRLSNVILIDDEKVINPPLRFPDEFVRHKILDIIGDFYLLGRPLRGKITAKQTGHTENIAMLNLIKSKMGL
jgi:UDP-3-O-acyl N-acetylglucosamine deacetylase